MASPAPDAPPPDPAATEARAYRRGARAGQVIATRAIVRMLEQFRAHFEDPATVARMLPDLAPDVLRELLPSAAFTGDDYERASKALTASLRAHVGEMLRDSIAGHPESIAALVTAGAHVAPSQRHPITDAAGAKWVLDRDADVAK